MYKSRMFFISFLLLTPSVRLSTIPSRNASLNWEYSNIFSVDLDPTRGGEHVHVNYSGKYEDENGADTWNSINRYYVIGGKVVWWDIFTQDIIDTESK